MSNPTSNECPTTTDLTGGTAYKWPMMGATSLTSAAAVLKECRSGLASLTDCSAYAASGYPTAVYSTTIQTVSPVVLGCLESNTRCPGTAGDPNVGTNYRSAAFILNAAGNTILGCYVATGSDCSAAANTIEVFANDGATVQGCITTGAAAQACGFIANPAGYPLSGTFSTYQFKTTSPGTGASTTLLLSCTVGPISCAGAKRGTLTITGGTTQLGCTNGPDTLAECQTYAAFVATSAVPTPYPSVICNAYSLT